jgi:DNA gyrase/topoisomerase IV subunit A
MREERPHQGCQRDQRRIGREHECRIVIDLKRDADPQVVINQLYEFTPCQITVSMINTPWSTASRARWG